MGEAGRDTPDRREPDVLPGAKDPDLRAWVRLLRIRERVGRRLERVFADHGLSPAQFDILATLSRREGVTQQELSGAMLVTKGNVTGLIDRAERDGLVERRADPEDRRANRLFLTEGGRRRLAETLPDHRAVIREVFGPLGPTRLQALQDLLREIDPGGSG